MHYSETRRYKQLKENLDKEFNDFVSDHPVYSSPKDFIADLGYRETDMYKAIVNSKERTNLLKGVNKVVKDNDFSAGFTSVIFTLAKTLLSGGSPLGFMMVAFSALAYLVLPMDFIPDFMPGGFIDDMYVMGTAISMITRR